MSKHQSVVVQGIEIAVVDYGNDDYISLTDMLRAKNGDYLITDWLRNRNTVEFLGIWESIYNPGFNYGEFAIIKSKAGLNSFRPSVKDWVTSTNAIGLRATAGRYGGTYAHKDIAFEFGMWISPEFKIYLIKEFDRLKQDEQLRLSQDWDLQRTLAKINYRIHTDAIRDELVPPEVTREQARVVYANEGDLLNVALFGMTAGQWRALHPDAAGNMRDEATLEQLIVLSNLESINAVLIREGMEAGERLVRLNKIAIEKMRLLVGNSHVRMLAGDEGNNPGQ
jgi:hypothetical protein